MRNVLKFLLVASAVILGIGKGICMLLSAMAINFIGFCFASEVTDERAAKAIDAAHNLAVLGAAHIVLGVIVTVALYLALYPTKK